MTHPQQDVQTVQLEDLPRLAEIWEASVRATHNFITEADIRVFRPLVRDALPELTVFCVRDHNGAAVGFIGVSGEKVEMLFVHPAYFGVGVGRQLMDYAVTTLGCTAVDVNEGNEQALGFYLKLGFEVVGRSERDGMGKPYPLLHLRLRGLSGKVEEAYP